MCTFYVVGHKELLFMNREKVIQIEEKNASFRSKCEELQLPQALNIQVSKEIYILNLFLGGSVRLYLFF